MCRTFAMCGGGAIQPIVKEKRRNSEKRKEKSRDAARCRRSKESELYSDLSSELPLSSAITSALDKASVMRLSVGYLKVKEMIKVLMPVKKPPSKDPEEQKKDAEEAKYAAELRSLYASVLSEFLLVLSEEGDVIYISNNVEDIIGISQVEMMGHSVYDFCNPCDHDEIKTLLTSKLPPREFGGEDEKETISAFIRVRSTLKTKGRGAANTKSPTYQVIHFIGHKFDKPLSSYDDDSCPAFYLVFIGSTIPHPAQIDTPLEKDIFLSRHSPDMKITHIDDKIFEFLGYKSSELIGNSVFAYHHALDAHELQQSFKTLFAKGQCETGYYRFLSKHGGYVWLVTQATLICESGSKPECVVCLNYVLSKIENQDELVSEQQELKVKKEEEATQQQQKKKPAAATAVDQPSEEPAVHLSTTSAIFAPKETVMSKDFLNFPETDILLFQEPLKDSKLPLELDLFPDDDPCSINSGICDDPFSYRDDSLSSPSYCGTPESSLNLPGSNSTSPDRFNTTPNTPDSGNLSDLPSLDPIDEFSNLDLKFTMPPSVSDKDSDCYEEDLDFISMNRAPFISMNMDDDFPLISPSSSVMWGPQEHLPKKSPPERSPDPEPQRPSPKQSPQKPSPSDGSLKSSLAALLQSDLKKHQHQSQHSNKNGGAGRKRWPSSTEKGGRKQASRVIMLDSVPKRAPPQRGGAPRSPPYGSHTATVKVHDRLIKVQVSVSELPTTPIEQKQPFPSPPDPPPKRAGLPLHNSPKRIKLDGGGIVCSGNQGLARDSVLLNLLISGEDASRGYLCSGNNRYTENKLEPALLSLPSSESSSQSESELLDNFLRLSQYEASDTPCNLLQGDDLLSALDHPLLLRQTLV